MIYHLSVIFALFHICIFFILIDNCLIFFITYKVTFDRFNVSLLNTLIFFLLTPNFGQSMSYSTFRLIKAGL